MSDPARSKLGPRLKVVAIIDPAVDRAKAVLQKKCETFVRSAYEATRVYRTLDEFVADMSPNMQPRAFVVGSPPMFRGTTQPRRDVELQILKHFPGVALFVEKPVTTGPKEEIADAFKVADAIKQSGSICSVGCVPQPYVTVSRCVLMRRTVICCATSVQCR